MNLKGFFNSERKVQIRLVLLLVKARDKFLIRTNVTKNVFLLRRGKKSRRIRREMEFNL